MKKILVACLALLGCCAVYAQKPMPVCVAEDISVISQRDNDSRTGNLAAEYFKSELATHSGISIIQSDALSTPMLISRGFKRGAALEQNKIAALCKDLKADYICFVRVDRKPSNMDAVVSVYTSAGVKKADFKRQFDAVRSSDIASILLANDVAIAIRGHNPVDDVNLIRVKQLREKMKMNPNRNDPDKADPMKVSPTVKQ